MGVSTSPVCRAVPAPRAKGTRTPDPCLQIRLDCRVPAITWDGAFRASAGFGPCRVPLWSALVVSAGHVSVATI